MENKGYIIVFRNSETSPYLGLCSLIGTENEMDEIISNLEKDEGQVYAYKGGLNYKDVSLFKSLFSKPDIKESDLEKLSLTKYNPNGN